TFVNSGTLKFTSDGSGGTIVSDPPASTTTADASTATADASPATPDATVTPGAKTSTPTATKTTTSQTKAPSATDTETESSRTNATSAAAAADEAIMVALSTAVAVSVALDTAVADPDSGKTSSLTISGNDTAVDITGTVSGSDSSIVDSGAALKLSPVSLAMAETLTDKGTVEVINGKPAGAVSETGASKIDAGAALQLDGSDAVSAPVITDGGNHTTKTAWHVSDDGRGGKTTHNAPASETGEDTSAQSTAADNHFTVSSPFTETPSGNGDHSASAFKPSVDRDATVDPGINLASIPKDHLPQHPADNVLHTPAPDHGADPAHPHVDGSQSTDEDTPMRSAPANNGHHWGTDSDIKFASIPQNDPPEHPADDDGSPAATDGTHPGRGQGDGSEPASPKFADVGGAHSAHATDEDPSVQSAPANNGHHWG